MTQSGRAPMIASMESVASDAGRIDASEFAGVLADLVGAVHMDAHEFHRGMLDDVAERPRTDVAGGPLRHSIRPA